jgi:large subunit ribosomal protein L30
MPDTTQADVIEITQVRSIIGAKQAQRRTLRALGLRRIRQTVSHPDRPEIRGMLAKVAHLIEVQRAGDDEPVQLEAGQQPTTSDEEQT